MMLKNHYFMMKIKFDKNAKLEDNLNSIDDSDIGYFVEVDLSYTDRMKKKTKKFPLAAENKKIDADDFSDYMKKIKPDKSTQTKNMICDWSDKESYLIHCRMLKFYNRHGTIVERIHETIFHLSKVSG